MIGKKRILYFMPDPPTKRNHGNRTHAMQMLEYFSSRLDQVELDYMGVREWGWDEQDPIEFKKKFPHFGLIVSARSFTENEKNKNRIKYFFGYKLPNKRRKKKLLNESPQIDDYTTLALQNDFDQVLRNKKYDVIIISYVTWANLVRDNKLLNGAKLINDTHDFMTAQQKHRPGFQLGNAFEQELERLSLFDEIWSQSTDEHYLFSQFLKKAHRFVPIMFDEKNILQGADSAKKKYDLIYVGSDNENNKQSINWFFNTVYPLLPAELNICIIGLVCNHFPSYKNVEKHLFVDRLEDYYKNAKIAICPMLEGTGVKVKVVEAMSFGLPTVCNLRGLDGLPMKYENGCLRADTPTEFAGKIKMLLGNESYRHTISVQAKAMFSKYFTKKMGYKTLDLIFDLHTPEVVSAQKEPKKAIFSESLSTSEITKEANAFIA